jgi:hypothetical protein
MDLLMPQPSLFEVSEREIEQRIAAQDSTDGAFQNVGHFIVENLRCVCVLGRNVHVVSEREKFAGSLKSKTQLVKEL